MIPSNGCPEVRGRDQKLWNCSAALTVELGQRTDTVKPNTAIELCYRAAILLRLCLKYSQSVTCQDLHTFQYTSDHSRNSCCCRWWWWWSTDLHCRCKVHKVHTMTTLHSSTEAPPAHWGRKSGNQQKKHERKSGAGEMTVSGQLKDKSVHYVTTTHTTM